MKATISADVIASTSLSKDKMISLGLHLQQFLCIVESMKWDCWGRIVRGDGVECVLDRATYLLRSVLLLKFYVRAYCGLDVRIASAIGELRTNDREHGIIDGETIYDSGRALAEMERRTGRATMLIKCRNENMRPVLEAIYSLLDFVVRHVTPKRARILTLKLQGMTDRNIAEKFNVTQSNVTTLLRRSGWSAMEKALAFFEEVF